MICAVGVVAQDSVASLPTVDRDGLEFYVYEVDKNESLYGISRRLNWDIDEIIAYNPEANGSLKQGFVIYYPTGRTINRQNAKRTESQVAAGSLPELEEAEAAHRINHRQNVQEEMPQQESEPENREEVESEGMAVTLPDDVLIVEHPAEGDSREANAPTDRDRELRVIQLVEDPTSKRESEFTKGFLMALDSRKSDGEKINYKIMLAPKDNEGIESTLAEITEYQPELIFSTHEKTFPTYLLDYVNAGPAEIVNVFDVRNDAFAGNGGVVQMMTPSASFSNDVADFAASRFRDRTLLVVGTPDSADEVGALMSAHWPGDNVLTLTPEELADMVFAGDKAYLVYINATTKNDISTLLTVVGEKREAFPLADISVFGRANWIVYADGLSDKFFAADVYFPSRFYFESDSRRGKEFRTKFQELYGSSPVKSFPMFSVTGYDEANYFLNALRSTGGDWNKKAPNTTAPLQAEIRLESLPEGGFVNPVCYVVRFAPFKMIDKMPLK